MSGGGKTRIKSYEGIAVIDDRIKTTGSFARLSTQNFNTTPGMSHAELNVNKLTTKCSSALPECIYSLMQLLNADKVSIVSGYNMRSTSPTKNTDASELDDEYYHGTGEAVDIIFYDKSGTVISPGTIFSYAGECGATGIAVYPGPGTYGKHADYVHLDVRDGDSVVADLTATSGTKDIWDAKVGSDTGTTYGDARAYAVVNIKNVRDLVQTTPQYTVPTTLEELQNYNRTEVINGDRVISTPYEEETAARSEEEQAAYDSYVAEYVNSLRNAIDETFKASINMENVQQAHKFFGAPFMFTNRTDPPATYKTEKDVEFSKGRTYATNIAAEAPLVHFIPGVPTYMTDFTTSERDVLSQYVSTKQLSDPDISESVMNKINGMEGRYFNFVPAWSSYVKYVNLLCRMCALYMGIGDLTVDGTEDGVKYKNVNYAKFQSAEGLVGDPSIFDDSETTNEVYDVETTETDNPDGVLETIVDGAIDVISSALNTMKGLVVNFAQDITGGYESVKCYVDPSVSFSEGVSNSTSTSTIASLFESGQSIAKEINLWAGGSWADSLLDGATNAVASIVTSIGDVLGLKVTNIANVDSYLHDIVKGYNITFPDMWSDSEYSKNYSFTINLVSPYGDRESIFLNIMVPMMFLLALALPRQSSANSFASPFMVRCIAKGWFSCDMGIITSLDIKRGGSDSWNVAGMPIEAEISISVKDLYTSLSMASTTQPGLYFNNSSLIEFLAATCGVDLTKPNLSLKIATFLSAYKNAVTDIPDNIYNSVIQSLNNTVMKFGGMYK